MPTNRPRVCKGVFTFVAVIMSTISAHAQFHAGDRSRTEAEMFQEFTTPDRELPAGFGQPLPAPGMPTTVMPAPDASHYIDSVVAPISYHVNCDACELSSSGGCCSACNGCCNLCQCPLPTAPCLDCPRVSTQSPYFNINVFGALKLDMLFNESRPLAPGTPFFLLPASSSGLSENTFDMHARQSTLGASLAGPQFDGFQSGGMVMAVFYNDAVIVDQYGLLPLQAWGELRNSDWRFSAGLQFDVFAPGAPTVLPFSILGASGNAGNSFRGQVRLERFIQPSPDRQWTIQLALSEPISSSIDPVFRLSEDNGWPNLEGRIALGCGCIEGVGAAARRPLEVGLSGVVGELRTTLINNSQNVADVWGVNADLYWKVTDTVGFAGEAFTGEALGTYNAGILQGINRVTFDGIRSSGGWLETFVYWNPKLHSHFGYGIDNPRDTDVQAGGRTKNETYFANAIWDVNSTFRVGAELAWRETAYNFLPDNDGVGLHTQFQWSF